MQLRNLRCRLASVVRSFCVWDSRPLAGLGVLAVGLSSTLVASAQEATSTAPGVTRQAAEQRADAKELKDIEAALEFFEASLKELSNPPPELQQALTRLRELATKQKSATSQRDHKDATAQRDAALQLLKKHASKLRDLADPPPGASTRPRLPVQAQIDRIDARVRKLDKLAAQSGVGLNQNQLRSRRQQATRAAASGDVPRAVAATKAYAEAVEGAEANLLEAVKGQ